MFSLPFSFDVQLLKTLKKFNLDVRPINIGAFFSTQIQELDTAQEKTGKSVFQEKVFHALFFNMEQFT